MLRCVSAVRSRAVKAGCLCALCLCVREESNSLVLPGSQPRLEWCCQRRCVDGVLLGGQISAADVRFLKSDVRSQLIGIVGRSAKYVKK